MGKKPFSKDLEFLTQNKHQLFSERTHYKRLLQGDIHHPGMDAVNYNSLIDDPLTFGQLISSSASKQKLTMNTLSTLADWDYQTIVQLYDDMILPWHLPVSDILKLVEVLELGEEEVLSAIENHPIEHLTLEDSGGQIQAASALNTSSSSRQLNDEMTSKRKFILKLANFLRKPE